MENSDKKILHSLDKYLAIGFDVDHCLVRYRIREVLPILYESIARVLVDEKGYPKEMLEFGKKEMCFVMNGLVIDPITAYIFKLGENKIILRAYHGYERVSQQDLEAKFGSPPKYEIFNPYNARNDDYTCSLTFFECFIPSLFAHMIEFKKKTHHPEEINAKQLLKDISYAVLENYGHYNDQVYHSVAGYGYFFPKMVENVDSLIYKQDKMRKMLENLKQKGKILFIVSNSHYEYVELLMDHAFGKDWKNLFDFTVAKAHKPAFFASEKPFMEIDVNAPNRLGKTKRELNNHEVVAEGSAKLLEENITRISAGKTGRILFFGDNYSTDVLAAETIAHWDAVCIMEEMGDIDFGEGYDESFWGHWKYEETPYGNIPTYWSSLMSKSVAMCTSLTDSIEMCNFYEL